jgi:hypothetical protein
MAKYRFSRTLPTGWRIRLDYIPWDGDIDDTPTEVDDVALLEIGEHLTEFDELPYGLIQPQTLKIKLAFSRLPSALQAYIRSGREDVLPLPKTLRRNIFVLYSDRGTGGVTWTTEFVGVENDTDGFTVSPTATEVYEYDVELVDVVYHAMKTLTGNDAFTTGDALFPRNPSTPLPAYRKLFGVLMTNRTGCNTYQNAPGPLYMPIGDVLEWMGRAVRDHLIDYYFHGTDFLTLGVNNLPTLFASALELKSSDYDDYDRDPGSALTSSTAYVVSHAGIGNAFTLDSAPGGLLGRQDKYGWGRDDVTVYDIMRDICETLGIKCRYGISITSSGLGSVVQVDFTARRVGSPLASNTSVTGYDAQIAATQMLERPSIGRGENNIGKAEVRWESEFSEDVKELVRLKRGTDGSRSMNVEPIIHNAPVYLPNADEDEGRYGPLLQTNLIYFKRPETGQNTLVMAHENTRYYYLPGGAYVQVTTTAMKQPVQHDDNEGNYRVQLNSVQAQATMAYGLTQLLLHLFSNPDNATIECTWNALKTPTMLPNNVGGVYDLSTNSGGSGGTADFADVLPNLAWTKAIMTSSSHNWMTGEISTKFFLLAATGNVG